jgi:transcription initiation factor TFIID subunit TAF12
MDQRWASAEWERQREHEAYVHHDDHIDDFVDSGSAKRYFDQNRARILGHLSGEQAHEQGNFDWYKEWEEWARQQWQQQQQQQQQQYGQQQQQQQQQTYQQQQQQQTRRSKPQPEYQWDFDKNDPYSVLGIRRGATKEQVSAAFRKEMLKHHPDVAQAAGASEAEKARAVERSKLITEAYRKVKAEMKK